MSEGDWMSGMISDLEHLKELLGLPGEHTEEVDDALSAICEGYISDLLGTQDSEDTWRE